MDSVFTYRAAGTAAAGTGPLQGLKIAIQPNLSVAGWPTDAGSNALADFRALEDATVVQRLRRAGACICGMTRMSEFGFGLQGSMAGAAVQQQAADAELVLDLMGESRLAAARAGICGFKPSYGLVSRQGLIGLIPSMECGGVLSGSVRNIRAILQAIAGPDELDFSMPAEPAPDFAPPAIAPEKIAIGFLAEARRGLSGKFAEGFQAALDELKPAGFPVKELAFPDYPLFAAVHQIVGAVEASSCAGRYDSVRYGRRAPGAKNWNEMYRLSRGAAFGPRLKSFLFQGAFFQFDQSAAYENACRIRARLVQEMERLAAEADILAFPAGAGAAAENPDLLADAYAPFAATLFANLTGQPVLQLPAAGQGQAGVQLAGPRRGDARLLALGEHLLDARRGGK